MGGLLAKFETKCAVYINNKNKSKGYIKSVLIHLKNTAKSIKEPFKLWLYNIDKQTGLPSNPLINGMIVQNSSEEELKNEMAIILVTHKMQTAKIADRIYIIEDGVVSANGTPKELLKTDNFFSQLVADASF